ncbi:FAD binding domain-containing protein [Apiospora phragmitis]|uniref:FAD binding domain-containing protein n=1 Tax=Apiospora phragmitis TaxID=2905665 RepID=A0ABR1WU86_9PEZI
MDDFITSLTGKLSIGARILLGPEAPDFQASMKRWSNLDVSVPYTIVQPAEERDIVATVQGAIQAGIPFVSASGGHSSWSTIGQEGIVIDLSSVRGGKLMKELQTPLHPHKWFTGT